MSESAVVRHRAYEDILALAMGTLVVSLGIAFFAKATLLTGSTVGLSLLMSYGTGLPFGLVFFALNLPFYVLAVLRVGWGFAIRTFVAVVLVSVLSRVTPQWVEIATIQPLYAAVIGGTLCGIGMLMLFRHRAGLGGINILAFYLQERYGLRAGYVQLGIDLAIMLAAFAVLSPDKVGYSLVGVVVLNLIVGINHRPGRYLGVS
ncbi:YitT family protein [Phreatobacter aquaticus]|uniref:YitT family protein n=1 Tax=Phreatobacter aquaticus TaxID=2570229 RepID=A0A4D7QL39_9HYPH|nr:YitT family protein [Phreatobacter aquaticus]QCK86723.1 YitT family protein [Phreatobacter aquaticus]